MTKDDAIEVVKILLFFIVVGIGGWWSISTLINEHKRVGALREQCAAEGGLVLSGYCVKVDAIIDLKATPKGDPA